VPVARVAGLEAGRLALRRGRAEEGLAVPPVLRRRSPGAGESQTVAVLQAGEREDAVGVGRTLGGLAVAGDLARGGGDREGDSAESGERKSEQQTCTHNPDLP